MIKANKVGGAELKDHQKILLGKVLEEKAIVVLPTGKGKTPIALKAIPEKLKQMEGKKAVFLAPTRPLTWQNAEMFKKWLGVKAGILTGEIDPQERIKVWKENQYLVATPQTIKNDVEGGRISFDDVGIVIFDEAHHATGDYPYVFIADLCKSKGIYVTGLTASPGRTEEEHEEMKETLGVNKIETTKVDDGINIYYHTIYVDLTPEIKQILSLLSEIKEDCVANLEQIGYLLGRPEEISRRKFGEVKEMVKKESDKNKAMRAMMLTAMIMRIEYAAELVGRHSVAGFLKYINNLKKEKKKWSIFNLLYDERMIEAKRIAKNAEEHPKIKKLVEVVREGAGKCIVFSHYRLQAGLLCEEIKKEGISCALLVGHATKESQKGMTDREQMQVIENFKEGKFQVLIATRIGEEGLDIPEVDRVIFYDQTADEKRMIQRRGRTGRERSGTVIHLLTKETPEEALHFAAMAREKKMYRILQQGAKQLKFNLEEEKKEEAVPF